LLASRTGEVQSVPAEERERLERIRPAVPGVSMSGAAHPAVAVNPEGGR
jgi:hypothetical protein